LNLATLQDAQRESTLAGIQKVAQQSALFQIPTIAASYAALGTKGTTFTVAVATAAAYEQQFKAGAATRDLARDAFDRELNTFKTLVENNATSAADVTGMGLALLTITKSSKAPPDPPTTLLVLPGKVHGKARVMVQGSGYLGHFAAEMSLDPIGTWTSLPGTGKERRLSGFASGTKVWVHFATLKWGLQSAWSAPVLVIIP
jgi:hypothetical protein